MLLSQEQLAAVFDDMAERMRERDSIEGNISYEFAEIKEVEGVRTTFFEVKGMYRQGNSDGQGGCRVFSPTNPPPHNRRAEDEQSESVGTDEDFDVDLQDPDEQQPVL